MIEQPPYANATNHRESNFRNCDETDNHYEKLSQSDYKDIKKLKLKCRECKKSAEVKVSVYPLSYYPPKYYVYCKKCAEVKGYIPY